MDTITVINTFSHNIKHNGLGDFIRGCLFLHHNQKKYNIKLKIDVNHSIIAKYIENAEYSDEKTNEIIVYKYDFENKLTELRKKGKKELRCFIGYKVGGLKITKKTYNYVFKHFQPNKKMHNIITAFKNKHKIDEYELIHFRMSDIFMDKLFYQNIIYDQKLKNKFLLYVREYYKLYLDDKTKYVVISDVKYPKYYLDNYPNFYFDNEIVVHLGNIIKGNNFNEQHVINSLKDFFLIMYAKKIHNISTYPWPSNFSFWVSKYTNVDYIYYYMKGLHRDVIIKAIDIFGRINRQSKDNKKEIDKLQIEINKLIQYVRFASDEPPS